ncbi:processing protease CtpA [Thermacetogenium phaeum DSM 12270]|jgi:carboxyl-terminal processing protease|uniref:Processing protease CtpA n=1 Tax=Thermacetogenium phaeum (strain ATCC BAA-254 / DSM 26808 / PB) TaxID=1089553 RepID=K4LFN6_THEPS|nr:S41 family peptidase [Thermacetogenium phaeum]AFV10892.1 processing protease CtpA [Thermacetogenium phaeum DSM 12270]
MSEDETLFPVTTREVDRLRPRFLRISSAGVALLFLLAALAGLFIWARKSGLDKLVRTYILIKTQYLEEVGTAELVNGAVKGMVEALKDPYSVYLDEDAYRELNLQIEGTFGGIGVEIDLDRDQQLIVVSPLPGTPAGRAGIKSGDIIREINGRDTKNMTIVEAANLLRGQPGTEVSLLIWRKDENRSLRFNLVREQIAVPSVTSRMLAGHPGIGYLQVMHFNRASTNAQLRQELSKLEAARYRGVILDLRGNPGGDLEAAVELAGYFLKKGPVVRIVHREGIEDIWPPRHVQQRVKVPLVVLVDGGSASASEIVAGAIKDTGSGILVGTRTFGKGLVQTVFSLGGGEGVKLTTNKYLTPGGLDIHKKGILPDVVIEQPEGTDSDVQLEKAIEILEEQLKNEKQAA